MHGASMLLAVVLTTPVAGSAPAATVQNVVARFFPAALTLDSQNNSVPGEDRHSAFVVGDLNHDGSQYICAVYWNNDSGAISVLSPAGDGSVVASILPRYMGGVEGEVELLDLDHDGRPEIVVTISRSRGLPGTWIFKWTGTALRLIGPIHRGGDAYDSDLADATFLDVDGDGTVALVDHHVGGRICDDCDDYEQFSLFRMQNGDLKLSGRLDSFLQFTRGTGAPTARTATFTVAVNPSAARQLIVVNGERDGSARVSSAQIVLNGQPVVGPSNFNQKVGVIHLPVALSENNTLTVTLDGKPGGTVTLLLLPTP
ncbi:MAG TPA: hypothetical protein VLC46_17760 [Thermoanaerobaculia bacterium]|nr:hypothetical protein [Thermoanaerobaculia bacterium]